MKIIFARHCESEANIIHELSNRGLRHPLTKTGREQASLLAEKIKGRSITRIYSSPLLRAIETSAIIAGKLVVEYEVADGLREYDLGVLEGRRDSEAWNEWKRIFDGWSKDQHWDEKIEDGESFYQVRDRFVPFVNGLVAKYGKSDANLLCVGHGGIYAMMLPLVLSNVDSAFVRKQNGFPYTEVIVCEAGPKGLVCKEWGGLELKQ